MANLELFKSEEEILSSSIFDQHKGANAKTRGQLIERKIDVLESLAGKVSNRRSRRWLNDRILIELVPRLNVEEIRGLFAPPPWETKLHDHFPRPVDYINRDDLLCLHFNCANSKEIIEQNSFSISCNKATSDDAPLSAFCMTNVGEWDAFRNVDMDAEARMIGSLENLPVKRKDRFDNDKAAALKAWHRVDCRTREALRRNFLSDLVAGYEECLQEFIRDSGDGDALVLHVQDPFHRLLLHGVCEFYNLISVTTSTTRGGKLYKTTRIKKKSGSLELLPNITLASFLKMAKDGSL